MSSENELAELHASGAQSMQTSNVGPTELRGLAHQPEMPEVTAEPERAIFTDDGELVSDLPDDFDLRAVAETKVRHWSTQVMGELLGTLKFT